jgi:hypothetical protein
MANTYKNVTLNKANGGSLTTITAGSIFTNYSKYFRSAVSLTNATNVGARNSVLYYAMHGSDFEVNALVRMWEPELGKWDMREPSPARVMWQVVQRGRITRPRSTR